jgi:DNA-binding NtrC family response regulator
MAGTVLIVEDETRLASSMSCHLKRNGYLVGVCAVGKEVAAQLESLDPDIVLVNHELPDMDGLQVLRQIRASDSRAKVIMAIRAGDARVAEDAIQAGAHDYLNTPLVPGELQFLLDKVAGQARLESAYQYYQDREAAQSGLAKLIGQSSPMRALKDRIHRFLAAERTLGDGLPPAVLVTGATGTGKKLVARAFHFEGMRRDNPFVEINCASTPDHEMEAALFGFASGAVNDATQGKPGLVEAAQGGTLFVDEITAMDTAMQAKLLTLLEDGKARRLGSARDRNADVRIIAASRRELERPVQSGRFRADLMFRLRIMQIHLPPLRERGDDVLLLAREFLAAQGLRKGKEPLRLTSAAELALLRYRWPGNVRELKNDGKVDAEHGAAAHQRKRYRGRPVTGPVPRRPALSHCQVPAATRPVPRGPCPARGSSRQRSCPARHRWSGRLSRKTGASSLRENSARPRRLLLEVEL